MPAVPGAITEALESALDIAQQEGRDSITYDDIDAAVKLDFKPLSVPATPNHKLAKARPVASTLAFCVFLFTCSPSKAL